MILRLAVRLFCATRGSVLGATITSASGAILAKGAVDCRVGESEFTMIFAAEVGDRWSVKRCG